MILSPDHPDAPLLLALVEGEPLSPSDRSRAERALASDPALAGLVESLRADRLALVALGSARMPAPADLVDRIGAALDAAALRALAGEEAVAAVAVPVSRVEYTRPSIIARIGASRWLRPAALAAGLLLAGGIVLIAARAILHRQAPAVPVAVNPQPDAPSPEPSAAPAGLAHADPADAVAPESPEAASPVIAPDAPGTRVAAAKPRYGIPLDRALELAAEGRLAIRVRAAGDPALARQRIARVAPAQDGPLDDTLRLAVASPTPSSGPLPVPGPIPAPAIAVASPRPGTPAPLSPTLEAPAQPAPWRLVDSTFVARLGPSRAELRALLRSLEAGAIAVEAIELPQPLHPGPGTEADELLWWTRAATWSEPLRVPVALEVR